MQQQKLDTIHCATHGEQQRTFVCQHIIEGLAAKTRVGFFWTQHHPENPRPDAWCTACEKRVRATEGEWVGDALANLQPKVLCGACYDQAKIFHSGGTPWS